MTEDAVRVITVDDLKTKMERGDRFQLVNALGDWEHRASHIPGSVHLPTLSQALEALDMDDDVVVYCSNPDCLASCILYRGLEARGFRRLQRFEGGLDAWERAGLPLEGEAVAGSDPHD